MIARGTVLTVSMGGGIGGKPRPVVVVQASDIDFAHTLVVVPLTSRDSADLDLRPVLLPDDANGLKEPSSLMTHRIAAVSKSDIGTAVGALSAMDMERVDAALTLVLGLNAV